MNSPSSPELSWLSNVARPSHWWASRDRVGVNLAGVLAGLDDGSSGEGRLVGQPLHNMDEEARAKLREARRLCFSVIYVNSYPLNALENVELPALLRGE